MSEISLETAVKQTFPDRAECLLQYLTQSGINGWNALQSAPTIIGRPRLCGVSVYELVEQLNEARNGEEVAAVTVADDLPQEEEKPEPRRRKRKPAKKEQETESDPEPDEGNSDSEETES
jgi:hypothetical protein